MAESCHYPAIPTPIKIPLTTLTDHPCPYLPGRIAISRGFLADQLPPELYHAFMDAGFRRSGKLVYQPICRGCRACVPIRVPVDRFRPNKAQRRCWKRNQDLHVEICEIPEPSEEKFALYSRYMRDWHRSDESHDRADFVAFLYSSPINTREFVYRDQSGNLLGVGLCDLCEDSLSSVYFYFDPRESRRGLGTFSSLYELQFARQMRVPFYYLGYWVKGCSSMSYKAQYQPYQLLGYDGVWRESTDARG